MTVAIDTAGLAAAVMARLAGDPRLDVFDGEPIARFDSDGRAHPYAACYFGAGHQHGPALCSTPTEMRWSFQVTAAGGDQARCRRAAARVRARLLHFAPVVAGLNVGPIRELDDYEPRESTDQDVIPSRVYVPLLFTTEVSASHQQVGVE